MRAIDWCELPEGFLVTEVYDVETIHELPPLAEGCHRHPDEKWIEIADFDGTTYPPSAVAVGWQVFPNPPGEFDAQVILRPPALPQEGSRKTGLE